jgi:NADPH:quinone reductase-like Zn-dependent oxidoreductase
LKAVVFTEFGPPEVLRLAALDVPAVGPADVLIRVHASTVTTAECLMRRGLPRWGRVILGFRRPRRRFRVLGIEVAGDIVAVGPRVSRFSVGDAVFGFTGFGVGACAEFKAMPETGSLAHMPANATYEQAAAAVDGATTALYFLRDRARVRPGQKVLINGASGSIGTYAVQLAKHLGADVTGVCGPGNVELVRSLGADRVIDYTTVDFTRTGDTYDVIFDTVGKSSFARCRHALSERGSYVTTVGMWNNVRALWTSVRGGRQVVTGMSVKKNGSLPLIKELVETGKLTIVVDRCYPLSEIVEAHRYVETGHKRGNVVVMVRPATGTG